MKDKAEEIKSLNVLIKCTADFFDLHEDKLKEKNRHRHIVEARHIYHYIGYAKLKISSTMVGIVSKRDHATVLFSHKKVIDLMDTGQLDKSMVEEIYTTHQLMMKSKNKITPIILRLTRRYFQDLSMILKTKYS